MSQFSTPASDTPLDPACQVQSSDANPAPQTVIFLLLTALIGAIASAELVLAELQAWRDPEAQLACDINPLIGCSSSLLSWQAHLVAGVPNAVIGMGLFAAIAGVFAAWLRGVPPRWLLFSIEIGLSLAMFLIVFFLWQSVTVFRSLCPFCLVVWVCAILLWIHLGAALGALGWLPGPRGLWQNLASQRWLLSIIVLLAVALTVLLTLFDRLSLLF